MPYKDIEKRREYGRRHNAVYRRNPENRERIKKNKKKYKSSPSYKKYANQYMVIWKAKRRKNDISFRLNDNIRTIINHSMRGKKRGQKLSVVLGYTMDDLKSYLEKKFDKNMSWENYGKYWHIDHIKPKSLFNFCSLEDDEFKKCWSLNNLQPLEAKENIRKSNHYIEVP